jgi:hypothetical protein
MNSNKNTKSININNFPLEKISIAVNIVGLLSITLMVLFTQKTITYDEPFHLKTVELLIKEGFSIDFLRGTDVSAPGPLYAITHYVFLPLTSLTTPGIRLVNIILLLFIIVILKFSLDTVGYSKSLSFSVSIMSAPIIWPISGMALTEIPAMFFAYLGLMILFFALYSSNCKNTSKLFWSLLAGIFFGFSILGRQTFLVILPAIPLLLLRKPYFSFARNNLKYVVAFITISLIGPSIQFFIWGGLVPSSQARIAEGISITHGILYLSYSAVVMFIFCPTFFSLGKKVNMIIFVVSMTTNLATGLINITPGMSVAEKLLPEGLTLLYSRGLSSIILSFGIVLFASIINNILNNKNDSFFIFICVSILFMSLSSIKVTHLFSSRYVACAVPLILLGSVKYSQDIEDRWKVIRYSMGNLLGFLSLASYFGFS